MAARAFFAFAVLAVLLLAACAEKSIPWDEEGQPTSASHTPESYRWSTNGGDYDDQRRLFQCFIAANLTELVDGSVNSAHSLALTVLDQLYKLAQRAPEFDMDSDVPWAWEVAEYKTKGTRLRCWMPSYFEAEFLNTWLKTHGNFAVAFDNAVLTVAAMPASDGSVLTKEDSLANSTLSQGAVAGVLIGVLVAIMLVLAAVTMLRSHPNPIAAVKSNGLLPIHIAVIKGDEDRVRAMLAESVTSRSATALLATAASSSRGGSLRSGATAPYAQPPHRSLDGSLQGLFALAAGSETWSGDGVHPGEDEPCTVLTVGSASGSFMQLPQGDDEIMEGDDEIMELGHVHETPGALQYPDSAANEEDDENMGYLELDGIAASTMTPEEMGALEETAFSSVVPHGGVRGNDLLPSIPGPTAMAKAMVAEPSSAWPPLESSSLTMSGAPAMPPVTTSEQAVAALSGMLSGSAEYDRGSLGSGSFQGMAHSSHPSLNNLPYVSSMPNAPEPFHLADAVNARDVNGQTPLAWAVRLGHVNITKMLLGVGADGNLPNKHLQTPMHIVCMCDVPTEIIDALLAAGCSPNVLDSEHATPLMYACRHGFPVALATLLHAGADPSLTDSRDMTALMIAAATGQNYMLNTLLQHDAACVNMRDLNGWTSLHWAVAVDSIDCVRKLLAVPVIEAYMLSRHNESAFHLAARRGNLVVVQLLVDHYVNPPVRNASLATRPSLDALLLSPSHYGQSPLDLARQSGAGDVIAYLQFVLTSQEAHVVDAKPVIQTMTAASPLSSASVGTQGDSGIEDAGGARRVASKQTNKGKRSKSNLNRPRKDVDGALVEKRAKRRNYMQKRRHHQREEISEMEDKVTQLEQTNNKLALGVDQLRREADALQQLLSGRR